MSSKRRIRTRPIDPDPLKSPARGQFERSIRDRPEIKRNRLLVVEVLLRCCAGRADCYPSARHLGGKTGLGERTVRRILAELEALEVIVTVVDRSVQPAWRRIVFAAHPHARAVLDELGASPHVVIGRRAPAPRAERTPRFWERPVGAGGTNPVHLSRPNPPGPSVGAGVTNPRAAAPDPMHLSRPNPVHLSRPNATPMNPVTVEARSLEPQRAHARPGTGEVSPGSNGNESPRETAPGPAKAPRPAAAPPGLTGPGLDGALLAALIAQGAAERAARRPPAPAPSSNRPDPLPARSDAPAMRLEREELPICPGCGKPMEPARCGRALIGFQCMHCPSPVFIPADRIAAAEGPQDAPGEAIGPGDAPAVADGAGPCAPPPGPAPAGAGSSDDRELYRDLEAVGGATREEVRALGLRLTLLFRDVGSLAYWIGVVNQVRQGTLPAGVVIAALEKRKDPSVHRPAAVAVAAIEGHRKAREGWLRGRAAP